MILTDDTGNTFNIKAKPERIVSLVPSITKTIADLGGEQNLVAVTRFCKYPERTVSLLPKIGGPKNLKVDEILNLKPDIIFAAKEENKREQIEVLRKKFPVFVFDITNIDDALKMIHTISTILKNVKTGIEYINLIKQFLEKAEGSIKTKTIYLIWKNPYMAAGDNTFISSMLNVAGYKNIIEGRYPQVNLENMSKADLILLASEPCHFNESDKKELKNVFPEKTVKLVNGEYFSWYGTMMPEALKNIKSDYE